MKLRRILMYASAGFLLAWVVQVVVMVTRLNMTTFQHMLYVERSSISAGKLFMSNTSRQSMIIFALMCSLCFLGIYFVSFHAVDDFFRCFRLMLVSTGIAAVSWDANVLFFAPELQKMIWLKTYDLMLVFYIACVYSLVLTWLALSQHIKNWLSAVCVLATALAAAVILAMRPVDVYLILRIYSAVMFLVMPLTLAFQRVIEPRIVPKRFEMLLLLGPCAFVWLRSYVMFDISSPFYNAFHQHGAQLMTAYALFVCVYVTARQRSNLFFRRSQNRRFQEVMRIKTSVASLLTRYCEGPVDQIASLSALALSPQSGEISQQRKKIFLDIQNEINILKRHLYNIREFETLPNTLDNIQNVRVSMGTVFGYVRNEIGDFGVSFDGLEGWGELYTLCEPYSMIRANTLLLSALMPIRGDNEIHVACRQEENLILVRISVGINSESRRHVKSIRRMLEKGSIFYGIENEEDVSLFIAHNIICHHGSLPQVSIATVEGAQVLSCGYYLQRYSPLVDSHDALPASYTVPRGDDDFTDRTVALVSSSSEEIDLICSYLSYEPYHLMIITSEAELFKTLPTIKNLCTLIIGTTFENSSIRDLCWMIREEYSMGQLPILLVQRDPDLKTHIAAGSLANDIVTGSFERFEFCQKVRTLVELRQSVQATVMSRLAFLQAQMDPHFIFNTMTTIMAVCLRDPVQAHDLIGYFSEYLRSNLFSRELGKPAPIYQEIDLINAYLTIEKARFSGQVEYTLVNEVSQQREILPLLIEPLVENSVKHGVRPDRTLLIQIEIKESDGALHVCVSDNGEGFRPDRIPQPIANSERNKNRSIGLNNVRTRLKLFYGEELNVVSVPGEGTTVSFTLNNLPRDNAPT